MLREEPVAHEADDPVARLKDGFVPIRSTDEAASFARAGTHSSCGVPLDLFAQRLWRERRTGESVGFSGNTLVLLAEGVAVAVSVLPPLVRAAAGMRPIESAAEVLCWQDDFFSAFSCAGRAFSPEALSRANEGAAAGSLIVRSGRCAVGSRLFHRSAKGRWKDALFLEFLSEAVDSGRAFFSPGSEGTGCAAPDPIPSAWGEGDFDMLAWTFRSRGLPCGAGPDGFRITFPAEVPDGAAPDLFGAYPRDPRLEAALSIRPASHGTLGPGLVVTLELPMRLAGKKGAVAAAALNELEMEGRCDDFHLGAWSASPERKKLSYTSFFPNRLKAKGFSLETLVLASIRRAEWAERTAKEMAATQSR